MHELKDRLQALERIQAPDLREGIRGWEPRRPRIEPRRGQVGVILLALAIASAGIVFAVRAFRGTEQPPQPTTTIQNGKIAFAAYSGGRWQIFSIEPDGSERSQLTGLSTDQFHPAWSPDGSRIAFSAQGEEGRTEIYVMGADGSNLEQLTNGADWSYLPAWSPDGSRIAFVSNRDGNDEIYVMNADGSNQVRLTDHPDEDLSPVWSPDGKRIAFQSNRGANNEIFVMNPDGTGVRNLTNAPASGEFDPAWSPDGTKIAFASDRDANPEIYVMKADGSDVTRLTDDSGHDWNPAWAPDGSSIAFESDRDGAIALYTMEIDGMNPLRLTDTGADACCPAWQPVLVSEVVPSPTPSVRAVVAATTTVGADGAVRSVVYGEGAVWVAVTREGPCGPDTVLRIDPGTDEIIARISVDAVPGWEVGGAGMTIGAGSVWVTGSVEDPNDPPIGIDAVLVRIDPASNEVSTTIPLGGGKGGDVVVDDSGVWVAVGDEEQGELVRVDPATNEIVARIPIPYETEPYQDLREVVAVDGVVLVNQPTFENGGSAITVIDATTNQVLGTAVIRMPEDVDLSIGPLVAWNGEVWADNGYQLVRIDPRTGQLLGEAVQLPEALAAGLLLADEDRGLWFLGYDGRTGTGPRTLSRFDPETGEVQTLVDVPGIAPNAMAVGPNSVWVLDYHGTLTRIDLA